MGYAELGYEGQHPPYVGAIPANPTIKNLLWGDEYKMAQNSSNSNSSNQLVVPGAAQAIDQMKYEIASEFGVNLGGETTSRANGSVGGEITKRLVSMAQQSMSGFSQQ